MNRKTSFPPLSAPDAEILVLGSMPGAMSLEKNQYYAHPRNLFWPVIEHLFGIAASEAYARRTEKLAACGIALWDVLRHCEREGSLDSNIRQHTEVANDIPGFLHAHPNIRRICFNGQKAHASFRKHILKADPSIAENYELVVLPSTSPANASISREARIESWERALSM